MQDIRAGKIDEEGLGINNVAIALQRVGIQLMASETEFKDFGGVLEELARKWGTLNEVEQANIAKAVAGVRQANMFMILMTNMEQVLYLQTVQTTSAGLAMDRYQIYLQSVEAAQNKLKSSLQSLYQDAINDGLIVSVYNAATSFVTLLDSMGAVQTLIGSLVSILIAFKALNIAGAVGQIGASFLFLIKRIRDAEIAQKTLNIAASANPYILAISAAILLVTLLAGAIHYASEEAERHIKIMQEANTVFQESADEIKRLQEEKKSVEALWREYEKLGNVTKRSAEEESRYIEIGNQLHEIFPELAGTWDENYNFLLSSKITLAEILAIEERRLTTARDTAALAAQDTMIASLDVIKDKTDIIIGAEKTRLYLANRLIEVIDEAKLGAPPGTTQEEIDNLVAVLQTQSSEAIAFQDEIIRETQADLVLLEEEFKNFYSSLSPDGRSILETAIGSSGEARAVFMSLLKSIVGGRIDIQKEIKENPIKYPVILDNESLAAAVTRIKDNFSKVNEALSKIASGENLEEQRDALELLGIAVEDYGDSIRPLPGELEKFVQAQYDTIEADTILSSRIKKTWAEIKREIEESRVVEGYELLGSAMKEQAEQGYISAETVKKLQLSYYDLAQYITLTENGFYTLSDSARVAMNAEIAAKIAAYNLSGADLKLRDAAIEAAKGNFILAKTMIAASRASAEQKLAMIGLLETIMDVTASFGTSSVGASGGSVEAVNEVTEALQEQIDTREDAITEYEHQTDAIEHLIETEEDEIHAIEDQQHAIEDQIDTRQHQQHEIEHQIEVLEEQQTAIEDNIQVLEEQKDAIQSNIDALEEQKDAIQSNIDVLEEEQAGIESNIELLEEQKESIQAEIEIRNNQIEVIENQKDAIQELINEREKEIESIGLQIDALNEQRDTQIEALESQLSAYTDIINARKEMLASIKEQIDYEDELAEKEKSVSKLQKEIAVISLDNSEEAKAERLRLQEELISAQEDLDKTQRDRAYELQIQSLDKELEAYNTFIESQIAAVNSFYDASVGALESSITVLESEIAGFETQMAALDVEIENINSEITVLQGSIDNLDAEISGLQGQIHALDHEIELFQGQIHELDHEIEIFQEQIQGVDDEIATLQLGIDKLDVVIGLLQGQIDELDQEIEGFEEQIHSLDDQIALLQDGINIFEDSIHGISDAIHILREEIEDLNDEIDENADTAGDGGGGGGGVVVPPPDEGGGDSDVGEGWEYYYNGNGELSRKRDVSGGHEVESPIGSKRVFVPTTALPPPPPGFEPPKEYHKGVDSGFVGGVPRDNSNERFAKLMEGELVLTPKQMKDFINRTLPEIVFNTGSGGGGGGSFNFENLLNINVAGNLDENVIPNLEDIAKKMMEELNKTLLLRGYTRAVNQYTN